MDGCHSWPDVPHKLHQLEPNLGKFLRIDFTLINWEDVNSTPEGQGTALKSINLAEGSSRLFRADMEMWFPYRLKVLR